MSLGSTGAMFCKSNEQILLVTDLNANKTQTNILRSKCTEYKIDMETFSNFVHDFANTDNCTSAYAVDFGVLGNGETAMVEWNHGYSLGPYDMDATTYTDLLIARWEEVTKLAA